MVQQWGELAPGAEPDMIAVAVDGPAGSLRCRCRLPGPGGAVLVTVDQAPPGMDGLSVVEAMLALAREYAWLACRAGERARDPGAGSGAGREDVAVSVTAGRKSARFRFRAGPGGLVPAGVMARGVPALAVMVEPGALLPAAALARWWAGVVHSRMVAGAYPWADAAGVHPSEHRAEGGGP